MIAIVCGGREYTDARRLYQILDAAILQLDLKGIIEGECPTPVNADKMAALWAKVRGIPCEPVPAETVKGVFQGPARNHLMLTMLLRVQDDRAVIAFPGGRGTRHMCKIAKVAGVRVIVVDPHLHSN